MRANRSWFLKLSWLLVVLILALAAPLPAHAQTVHVVQRGETLSAIAARYGTSIQAIMNANGLRNANFIWVGQRLIIPGQAASGSSQSGGTAAASGGSHVVQRGEILARIAARYGTTVQAIVNANGLGNANLIYVGQRLRIPGQAGSSSGSTASTSAGSTGGSGTLGAKWIEVDLSNQRTYAHEGNAVARTMVVSTGIARYPTPPGSFRIYAKYPSVTMSGPGYYLTGVPHTMFFYRGYALHGTYWHKNFGHPMSHGCINLTKADAAWLYSWAPVGTLVKIHW